MTERQRPLSPHLGIYKWEVSNTLSILHRMTGVFLSLGAIVFVVWIVATASGPERYAAVIRLLMTPVGLLLIFGWTYSFFYHLGNGIRHLVWDVGHGFEPQHARLSGWAVFLVAGAITVLFWAAVLGRSGVTL